ncbi:TPA: nitrate/nitrite two-component system sensor histidine kinase NarQ [Mannheimia haemolytica]|uniref:Sensor protein n=2 Tax=Mannheimia haemolytica TaxID=75985 RepID=A0A547EPZ3_MANHA|nr:nitrate/nitrite two-component system sensor histidine kinase NarQ [Mannheimia haemolytica]AGI32596.2 nitrate/nitrite two-component system sensor histidine kinase NarQ [Mannheimia haemolytica USDA-ARS-USMARC-183]AGI35479.2 nitrate/nitrite two-component system sensor histidine kinase NarQ [Mannheimia haemolytica USDA-ARS-USMARC-185]AGK02285.1 sensor histidine kinase protein NarQ [Mannheimia haemolytica M42548]AKA11261.1 ATPase [Mannheimia haemolytica]AKA13865.1 ATPase [Mannheimia haemolytica]
MIKAKYSIARRIGLYFLIMIGFASIISGISLGIMWSNKSDASLINVSGSLRMQSYRLLSEMDSKKALLPERLLEYHRTLHATELSSLKQSVLLPDSVIESYQQLLKDWYEMQSYVAQGDKVNYASHIEDYVQRVDDFVFRLQEFAELKLKIATGVIAIAMLLIIALAYIGVWYTRKKIIGPLRQLVKASWQIQNKDFDHVKLAVNEPNELGLLSSTFTEMSNELLKLYTSLEDKVQDKTRRLLAVNRSLLVLYQCSQLLTAKPINKEVLNQVLKTVFDNEHLLGIDLQVYGAEYWNVSIDNKPSLDWVSAEIAIENEKLGILSWKPSLVCPGERLIQNVSEMIGRSLYVVQMQKQQQQLVLMEERAIIARELHDSLAQSLTFFKIQVSLLKLAKTDEKRNEILTVFEKALNDAYSQLRELLTTFRLTIQEANLQQALEKILESLRPKTSAQIRLSCKLPSHMFNAQQQVHVLQIVREAVINAIKHSQATEINVIAETNDDGEHCLTIQDNGVGLAAHTQPEGHYGLTIMQERAAELKAEFSIENVESGGVKVQVLLPSMISKR